MKTQKTRKSRSDALEQEKSSGKKMVQAILPFKLLTTPTSESIAVDEKGAETVNTTETRKRKLSFKEQEETDKSIIEQSSKRRSVRKDEPPKETANDSTKVKEIKKTNVIVLSDDSNDGRGNVTRVAKQKACDSKEESLDVHSDDIELIASTDEEETEVPEKPKVLLTPIASTKEKEKTVSDKKTVKKTTTPQSSIKSTEKGRKKTDESPKVQIKLPVNSKKNKRRKQAAKMDTAPEEHEMSDDVEIISKELHPEKRPKLESPQKESKTNEEVEEPTETNLVEKEMKDDGSEEVQQVVSPQSKVNEERSEDEKQIESVKDSEKSLKQLSDAESGEKQLESEDPASDSEQSKSQLHEISSTTSNSEAETTLNSERLPKISNKNSLRDANKTDENGSSKVNGDSNANKLQKKNLTPKQQKLLEQRLKAREEKERKIQEEREQKQREKEERELARKREREEKDEQRRKEREEKEEQRRKEREEKERKRLAEIEAKNEEKRKRNEAKEEEQRKKEDERKRKEQEKEEAEMKKKKAAMAFTKFFSRPAQDATTNRTADKDVAEENQELLAFRPFQIKGDMKLAPIVRKKLNDEERANLGSIIHQENDTPKDLYLGDLLSGSIKPYKWSPRAEATEGKQKNDCNDVILVDDELEPAGQAIVEEHNEQLERFRAKFFKFHENRRPPYFGTWRKKSAVITPRHPFAQDKKFFDYEVDSDDEWEEEEPGESLDGSDDDKEKESDDEDYEVDNEWFVPHGHLSEEELQNEDDLSESNDREAQKAKLKILQQEFAQEMKKKTEKIKPRLIGCIWVDENGNQPEFCPKIIWDTLAKRAILCADPPIMEETNPAVDKYGETNTANGQGVEKTTNGEIKLKPITLTDDMLKQLVKLIHGNTHSKNFLIKEFIAYIEANEESVRNGDLRGPLKSAVREKIDEYAQWQAVELQTLANRNETNKDGSKSAKAQKTKKKLCWVVMKDMLQSMNMDEMDLNNNWEYILQPRHRSRIVKKDDVIPPNVEAANGEDSNANSEASVDQGIVASGNVTEPPPHPHPHPPSTPGNSKSNKNPDIKKFTKVLTAEEKSQQLQRQTEQMKTPKAKESSNLSAANNNNNNNNNTTANKTNSVQKLNQTPTTKKRVPLLISVARGQAISTPDKNARISQFLKTINDAKQNEKQQERVSPTPMRADDVVVLD